jgi:hypothetical protein
MGTWITGVVEGVEIVLRWVPNNCLTLPPEVLEIGEDSDAV